ncbi:hypothetical protein DPMN_102571 [Dreissena polymorpha]|uniref:Uncharacterized protein n=1 Tax=Dreissena polymorpha TaxID=45954 RepID=A0A9D4LJK6_DREPO|nr:hypothetical protein DPMN_102571 [Dreissena polymorpha]
MATLAHNPLNRAIDAMFMAILMRTLAELVLSSDRTASKFLNLVNSSIDGSSTYGDRVVEVMDGLMHYPCVCLYYG